MGVDALSCSKQADTLLSYRLLITRSHKSGQVASLSDMLLCCCVWVGEKGFGLVTKVHKHGKQHTSHDLRSFDADECRFDLLVMQAQKQQCLLAACVRITRLA